MGMIPSLARARDAVDSARTLTDDSTAEEQLASIREAIATLDDEDELADAEKGDRLEEIERQLVELGDDLDGTALDHVERARDRIDAYRREFAPDWDTDAE